MLNERGIELPKAEELPTDVIEYIANTMRGVFWDNFVSLFNGMERSEVKATLFREVFYSHSTTVRNKEFGKAFASVYPNVWHVIRTMKKEQSDNLPNLMMKRESELFREILNRCWGNGWCVVSIHDAVIVLDVVENRGKDIAEIEGIMMEVYKEHGLFPTISVDRYR